MGIRFEKRSTSGGNKLVENIVRIEGKKKKRPFSGRFFETISRKLFRRRSGGAAGVLLALFPAFVVTLLARLALGAFLTGRGGLVGGLTAGRAGAAACLRESQSSAQNQRAYDCE
jgi:hypothetical protein